LFSVRPVLSPSALRRFERLALDPHLLTLDGDGLGHLVGDDVLLEPHPFARADLGVERDLPRSCGRALRRRLALPLRLIRVRGVGGGWFVALSRGRRLRRLASGSRGSSFGRSVSRLRVASAR
jgi:hypothetical protein